MECIDRTLRIGQFHIQFHHCLFTLHGRQEVVHGQVSILFFLYFQDFIATGFFRLFLWQRSQLESCFGRVAHLTVQEVQGSRDVLYHHLTQSNRLFTQQNLGCGKVGLGSTHIHLSERTLQRNGLGEMAFHLIVRFASEESVTGFVVGITTIIYGDFLQVLLVNVVMSIALYLCPEHKVVSLSLHQSHLYGGCTTGNVGFTHILSTEITVCIVYIGNYRHYLSLLIEDTIVQLVHFGT